MSDIFISYAMEDRLVEAGAEWSEEIQRELHEARCVLVLWSAASRKSFWVRGEAADAFERDSYVPLLIDATEPPRLFRHLQAKSIAKWVEQKDDDALNKLKSIVASRIDKLPMYGNLVQVADGEPVTDAHLHLVHSCWRVDKKTQFGPMPYQIHLIVYGHPTALARIESVEYLLPGYPVGHDRQAGGPPERLHELMELANGFSIAQAHIHLHSQPLGHPRILRLSRFINMSESGPRLFDDFIRRYSPNTLK